MATPFTPSPAGRDAGPARLALQPARLALQPGRGDALDEVAAVLAFVFVPLDLPAVQPVRALVTLVLLALLAWRWRAVAPTLRAGGYAFALPLFCLASALWAADGGAAAYKGALWGVTIGLAGMIGARLDHRQLVVALLVSQGALAAASLVTQTTVWAGGAEGGYVTLGVFPQKNVAGQRMMLLALACAAVLLSSGYAGRWRLAAIIFAPIAVWLCFASGSVTAILLLCGAGAALGFLALVWRPARRVSGAQPVLLMAGACAAPLALLVLANLFRVDLVGDLLAVFGKDRSLTGRTDIWAAATASLADNPLLGVGAANFWRLDSYAASRVASLFGATGDGFEFHNAYFEVAVHIGVLGLLVAVYVWGRGLWDVFQAWRIAPGRDPFLIALALCFILRSVTESELFNLTLPGALLFWVLLFMAARELAEHRAGPRRPTASPAATAAWPARPAKG